MVILDSSGERPETGVVSLSGPVGRVVMEGPLAVEGMGRVMGRGVGVIFSSVPPPLMVVGSGGGALVV